MFGDTFASDNRPATIYAPGTIRALNGSSASYLDGTGNWSVPPGANIVNPSVTDNFVSFSNLTGSQKDSGVGAATFPILAPGSSTRNVLQPTGATFTPLTLRGFAAQSADLFLVQTSIPATLFSISSAGNLNISGVIRPLTDSTTAIQFMKQANANLVMVLDTTNRRIGMGATPGNVHLQITGFSDDMQFLVRGHSAQTADLTQWQNSGGTVLASVSAAGAFHLFQTLEVDGHICLGANLSTIDPNFVVAGSEQTTIAATEVKAFIDVTLTGTANYAAGTILGGGFEAISGAPVTANWAVGASGHAINNGAGTLARAVGLQGLIDLGTTGAITLANGIQVQHVVTAAGTITTAAGFYFMSPGLSGGGAITTLYGMYMEAVTAGGTNYAIYTNAGAVRFGGMLTLAAGLTISTQNIVTDTGTGSIIATVGGAAGQKLGFWGAAPIVQPVLATGAGKLPDDIITALQNIGLVRQS